MTLARIERNSVLDSILARVPLGIEPTWCELIDDIANSPLIETSYEDASQYAASLLDLGLISLRTGISDQDADWDLSLLALLSTVDDDFARIASELITDVRALVTRIAGASAVGRLPLDDELRRCLDAGLVRLGCEMIPPSAALYYEDTTSDQTGVLNRGGHLEQVLQSFSRLLSQLNHLAWPREEQLTLQHIFTQLYSESRSSVPLLQFYEDSFRLHYKSHIGRQFRREPAGKQREERYNVLNPFGIAAVDELLEARRRISDLVSSRCRNALANGTDAELSEDDIRAAIGVLPEGVDSPVSLSVFCHVVPSDQDVDKWWLVVPNATSLPGFGKYFSRFLFMFDDEITARLRLNSVALSEALLAEIASDGDFNGNLHPKLLDYKIQYPSAPSEEDVAFRLNCADLHVERHPSRREYLRLIDAKSGKQVFPVDLGFLSTRLRPGLFQLLSRFQSQSGSSFPMGLISSAPSIPPVVSDAVVQEEGLDGTQLTSATPVPKSRPIDMQTVVNSPRVIYEGCIVLSRRRWLVPSELLPVRESEGSDADYFIRVYGWRVANGIPEHTFVRIRPRGEHGRELPGASARRRFRTDDRKPQFIDFASPLLVRLLEQTVRGLAPFILVIEEAIPDTTTATLGESVKFFTECLFQELMSKGV